MLRAIVRRCTATPGEDPGGESFESLATRSSAEWTEALFVLGSHNLLPLVAYTVETQDLGGYVPAELREPLRRVLRETGLVNRLRQHLLSKALAALDEHGVDPIVWKGVALASAFYPDPAARRMCDIDLAIEPDEIEATTRALTGIGLQLSPDRGGDALHFESEHGVVFDVHRRVRIFEPYASDTLTTRIEPHGIDAPSFRVYEPNAMLVHMASHMLGHLAGWGYELRWLTDFQFVLRQWGDRCDLDRITDLMPDPRSLILLLRAVRFVEAECGGTPPAELSGMADRVAPLSLEEVLRSRRLAFWGLPGLRGLARLLRDGVSGTQPGVPYPRAMDFVQWPGDRRRNGRLAPASLATGRQG